MGGFGGVRVPDEADDADDPAAEPFPLACCPEGLASRPLRLSYSVPMRNSIEEARSEATRPCQTDETRKRGEGREEDEASRKGTDERRSARGSEGGPNKQFATDERLLERLHLQPES